MKRADAIAALCDALDAPVVSVRSDIPTGVLALAVELLSGKVGGVSDVERIVEVEDEDEPGTFSHMWQRGDGDETLSETLDDWEAVMFPRGRAVFLEDAEVET